MRTAFALFLVCACGGPSQQQLVETPAATAPPRHTEAPPASTSDQDRSRLIQQFDDMETTQQAYEEAEGASQNTPAPPQGQPANGQPGQTQQPPKKKGPAEQAPKGAQ
jgi:hypothetical protein